MANVAQVPGARAGPANTAPGETVSDNDLNQRDLSTIDDANLSPDERREVQRRFDEFVNLLRERAGLKAPDKQKPKRITRWDPATIYRRH